MSRYASIRLLEPFVVTLRGVEHVLVFDRFSRFKRRVFKWWNGFGASFCTVLAWVRYVRLRLLRDSANKATGIGDITGYFSFLLNFTPPDTQYVAQSWRPI